VKARRSRDSTHGATKTADRIDIDLPASADRDLMIYTVGTGSRISARGVAPDGRLLRPRDLDRLESGDSVLVIAPPPQSPALDELFAERSLAAGSAATFGEFTFDGDLPVGKIAEFYDLAVPADERAASLAESVQLPLGRKPLRGDRIPLGDIELIVQAVRGERITEVAIELEPASQPRPSWTRLRDRLRRASARLWRRLAPARGSDVDVAHAVEPGEREQQR
jgi:cell volume regulation protein A